MQRGFVFTSILFLAACAAPAEDNPLTACPAERPQICTMIYDPVCAETTGGERRTFASDCVACGDKQVIGYEPGACPEGAD